MEGEGRWVLLWCRLAQNELGVGLREGKGQRKMWDRRTLTKKTIAHFSLKQQLTNFHSILSVTDKQLSFVCSHENDSEPKGKFRDRVRSCETTTNSTALRNRLH